MVCFHYFLNTARKSLIPLPPFSAPRAFNIFNIFLIYLMNQVHYHYAIHWILIIA